MKIIQLDLQCIGIKHTAKFDLYPSIIPEKVLQTKQRMKELGIDKKQQYIIYEPKKHDNHEVGYFFTGIALDTKDKQEIPKDMEKVLLNGTYAVFETIFDAGRMGEFYTQLDQWIYQSEYCHSQEHLIVELYKELPDGNQELTIFMPVVAAEGK
ncbi:MAG TPA: effector binding domain-containing protein [Cerasibacillus sp.]|uniref:effector binding domain-containing protein n=1 Tax=Cerasibacillus sp. TaxID=2498711 RepID=UPI002F42F0A9